MGFEIHVFLTKLFFFLKIINGGSTKKITEQLINTEFAQKIIIQILVSHFLNP